MNQLSKTALSGIGGTVVMTAGSEILSHILHENYREPDHLETMIKRLAPMLSNQAKVIAGWGAHLAIGFVFAAIYVELWETRKIKHTIKNGVLLGLISGILGLVMWKGTFSAHPLPPLLNYNHFYMQLIPAHIVFAVAATVTYKLIEKSEPEEEVQTSWNGRQAGTFRRVRANV